MKATRYSVSGQAALEDPRLPHSHHQHLVEVAEKPGLAETVRLESLAMTSPAQWSPCGQKELRQECSGFPKEVFQETGNGSCQSLKSSDQKLSVSLLLYYIGQIIRCPQDSRGCDVDSNSPCEMWQKAKNL